MKNNIELLILAIVIVATIALPLGVFFFHHDKHCAEYRKELVTTYPNIGMIGLGNNYLPLALMPITQEMIVCVRWQKK